MLVPADHEQDLSLVLFVFTLDGAPCAHVVACCQGDGAYKRACEIAATYNAQVQERPQDWRPGARFEVHSPRTGKPTLAKIHADAEHAYRRMIRAK